MADFVGTWKCEEHLVVGNLIIGTNFEIQIEQMGVNRYKVTMPTPVGSFSAGAKDQTISYKWKDVSTNKRYGLQLVFDHTVTPAKIVEGPLDSMIQRWGPKKQPEDMAVKGPLGRMIERWDSKKRQPEDMGTITGTRG